MKKGFDKLILRGINIIQFDETERKADWTWDPTPPP